MHASYTSLAQNHVQPMSRMAEDALNSDSASTSLWDGNTARQIAHWCCASSQSRGEVTACRSLRSPDVLPCTVDVLKLHPLKSHAFITSPPSTAPHLPSLG